MCAQGCITGSRAAAEGPVELKVIRRQVGPGPAPVTIGKAALGLPQVGSGELIIPRQELRGLLAAREALP